MRPELCRLKPIAPLLIAVGACFHAAAAEDQSDPWAEDAPIWQRQVAASLTLAGSIADDGEFVYRLRATGRLDRVLDNGLTLGAAGRFELQQDHPSRAGFSGLTGAVSAAPRVANPLTGLAEGVRAEATGPRGSLEDAYIFASGGYGEIRLGRDLGIAARHQVAAPSVFAALGTGSAALDPSGNDYVPARHDLTGPAAKVSYTTPRLLGIQAGLAFTPQADVRGLDRDPARVVGGGGQIRLEDAFEASLSLSRRLGKSDVRVDAALGWSRADVAAAALPAAGTAETWSAGARAATDQWSVGGVVLSGETTLSGATSAVDAWALGATVTGFGLDFGAEVGAAEDTAAALDADTWTLAVCRKFSESARASLGWRSQKTDKPGNTDTSEDGVVIEITLSR
jgi:Gram-negative porin